MVAFYVWDRQFTYLRRCDGHCSAEADQCGQETHACGRAMAGDVVKGL